MEGTGYFGDLFSSVCKGWGVRGWKSGSLCLSVYAFVGPLSTRQPSLWDNCPLYSNLPTFMVAAFTVPILLWNSITTGFWMQSFMISGYKQCAEQQRRPLYFLIFLKSQFFSLALKRGFYENRKENTCSHHSVLYFPKVVFELGLWLF